MILEIRLSNMFSIKDEIVLDMTSGGIRSRKATALASNCFECNGHELLKSVVIYGANAAGKTNIFKSVSCCRNMILHSHSFNEGHRFAHSPFRFGGYDSRPSMFFIRFISKGVEYEYSFSFTKTEIVTESLYHYPNGRRAEVFSRDERRGPSKSNIYRFHGAIRKPMDVALSTSERTLFVSRASLMDRDVAKHVYGFFARSMVFSPALDAGAVEGLFGRYRDDLLTALRIADSDITDVRMRKVKRLVRQISLPNPGAGAVTVKESEQDAVDFTTYHLADPSVPFSLDTDESEGTKNMFYNILFMIDVIRGGKTLFWDEINRSLHSGIVEYILELFRRGGQAQLICSTHDTSLLDKDKLRKDQIYFVNKLPDGSSDLYSLYDYKDFRDTMDMEKAYRQGRFDAVPYIDESALDIPTLTVT